MKNLDNVLSSKLSKTLHKEVKRTAKKQKPTKEQIERNHIREVIKLIKTGDFNPKLRSHQMHLSLAIRKGYVSDRQNMLILKED